MKPERRRNIRVPGPFMAWLGDSSANSVRIMDLSEGGCFIHWPGEPPPMGRPLSLKVTFPDGSFLAYSYDLAHRLFYSWRSEIFVHGFRLRLRERLLLRFGHNFTAASEGEAIGAALWQNKCLRCVNF